MDSCCDELKRDDQKVFESAHYTLRGAKGLVVTAGRSADCVFRAGVEHVVLRERVGFN